MKWILLLIWVLIAPAVFSQPAYQLKYLPESPVHKALKLKTGFSSKLAAIKYLETVPSQLLAKGWLAASIDSVTYDSTQAFVYLFMGTKYAWGKIDIPPSYSQLFSRRDNPVKGVVNPSGAAQVQEAILDDLSKRGHPFASVGLDSVVLSGDSLYGKLVVDEGPFYRIDSIHVAGMKLKPSFIYPYLHISKAMAYNQEILDRVGPKLDELLFAEVSQPWQLEMVGSGATVNTYLRSRRSNIINALIGLAPASTQTPGNKLLLSGEANILLRNAFFSGETIGINWQQLQYKSPRLNLLYQQPYLFGSQAGIDFAFELFKKDSQFVNINFRIGVPYDFSSSKTAKVFFQQLVTNVTYVDTNAVKSSRSLPDLADVSSSNLGLEYEWNTTDYRLNPRRGGEVFVTGIGGLKRIKTNSSVTQLKDPQEPAYNFESLYDTVTMKTYQLRLKARLATYLPAGRHSVLKLALNGGWYQSENYYRNELFQIGGSKLLRGFDEESIYARTFAVATAEFRFLTGRNSYFFGFSDGGYAAYKDQQLSYNHTYIGAGLGLALETKNSVINLSWAAGKRNDLPLNLRQSKIHLGFINYF
jgi:outer membrane protein assembly factor BamA